MIIELKNVEDRYIVSQIKRYYESLLRLKPFQPEVDYKLPIGMCYWKQGCRLKTRIANLPQVGNQ